MATESDLRDLLRDPDPEGRPAIDLDAVLARARRRRRPKVIAAQALGSVAAVGALFVGVAALVPPAQPTSMMVAEDSAGGAAEYASEPSAADGELLRIPAEACGEPFDATSAAGDWSLAIEPLTTDGSSSLVVPVTFGNEGAETLTGTASLPRIVITTPDGVVVGVAPAVEDIGVPIALEPGMSTTFDTLVQPYACAPSPDGGESGDLLPPGDYEMWPVLQFAAHGDDLAAAKEFGAVVGAAQPLVIR